MMLKCPQGIRVRLKRGRGVGGGVQANRRMRVTLKQLSVYMGKREISLNRCKNESKQCAETDAGVRKIT